MSRGYSKKWIPRSGDWTFWSTTLGYSGSPPLRRLPTSAFTSTVGSHPVAGALLYASTKGAIETLTRGLALELAPRKIRVNAIAPGHTETERNITAGTFEGGAAAVLAEKMPFGRLGRVDDIAPPAVFLASDESAWITGEVIRAAGGLVVAT
jgi:3-oxoacyl-[acyl-carrier protein] reductase